VVKVKQPFQMLSHPGDTLCKGGNLRLYASGAYAYSWSPATALNSKTSATPLASPQTTTTYRVIGVDDRNCFKDTNYVTVKVYPIPTVEAGEDKTINVGQSVDLVPTVSADVTNVTWTPTESIIANHSPSIRVQPKVTTDYLIEVRNPGGCKTKDRVTVHVLCNGANVFIPNSFSPNNDGMNDVFYPRGTGLFRIKSMRIFNRWGELIYEKNAFMPNDASSGWNGTHEGRQLNPDVYVYTIEIVCDNNNTLTFKGNISLIQ
ncbi:MAG TPA: gliding motility-associated C-terminal domain-containing protein, partial [Ferruginibacter sp.]|nr:gliding motility-associated C-terminal domain-containing protein [Ferruginibacter sp.]